MSDNKLQIRDEMCEMLVLGSMLGNLSVVSENREFLSPDCFYNDFNREVYEAIISVTDSGEVPDMIKVGSRIDSFANEQKMFDLAEIATHGTLGDIKSYCLRLKELNARRKMWLMGQNLIKAGTSEADDLDIVSQYMKDAVDDIFSLKDEGVFTLNDTYQSLWEQIKINMSKGGITGTPTGFMRLDEKGGLQKSDLVIIAGETSQGKTSLAMAITIGAIDHGKKVAFYSMEMTKEQLTARIIASKSDIPANDILYNGSLSSEAIKEIDRGFGMINADNLFFDDKSTSNIESILASIRTLKMKHDIDGVVVDYLQILNVNMKTMNKEQAMGDVTRRLKNIAKDLKIWVIALSQLSRDSMNPQPTLNRLRDSGQIAEAADVVMLVYRPEYYNRPFPEPFSNLRTQGMAMVDVAKGRNIGTFRFIVGFDRKTTKFYDTNTGQSSDMPSETAPIPDIEDAPF